MPLNYSLQSYLEVMFMNPRMQIIVQGCPVNIHVPSPYLRFFIIYTPFCLAYLMNFFALVIAVRVYACLDLVIATCYVTSFEI
jgi:hypothetical protein